jgi:hypothetical protein
MYLTANPHADAEGYFSDSKNTPTACTQSKPRLVPRCALPWPGAAANGWASRAFVTAWLVK